MPEVRINPEPSNWQVVHARAIGTSHITSGMPCQDAAGWRLLPSGYLAIALADGAGSAPQAETGAKLAVAMSLAALENIPANGHAYSADSWAVHIRTAFESARTALEEEALSTGAPFRDFATTLICLIAGRDGLVIGQVGDGAVVARTPLGDLFTLTEPQRGEYANETIFLTMPDALERGNFQAVELDLAGLAVMSDGLIRLALNLPDYSPFPPFFTPLWAFAARSDSSQVDNQKLIEFLKSDRVCSRTDDDKSLVIAVLPEFDVRSPAPDTNGAESQTQA
jgi:hypothetical protein